jgi:hypothetical protein
MRALFSKLTRYVNRGAREASQWARKGTTFWKGLTLTLLILVVFYPFPAQLADRVRWAGTLFELIGVGAVVISINRARLSFGKPTVLSSALIWLGEVRFIFFPRQPVALSAVSASAGIGLASGIALVVNRAPKSTEERLDQLEKELKEQQANLSKLDQKIDQQKREFQAYVEKEISALQADVSVVSKNLEERMIGDSPLEVAGIVYVCIGLVMAHLSEEVAWLLSRFGLT